MNWITILFISQPVIAFLLGALGVYCLYRWWRVSRETSIEPIVSNGVKK